MRHKGFRGKTTRCRGCLPNGAPAATGAEGGQGSPTSLVMEVDSAVHARQLPGRQCGRAGRVSGYHQSSLQPPSSHDTVQDVACYFADDA